MHPARPLRALALTCAMAWASTGCEAPPQDQEARTATRAQALEQAPELVLTQRAQPDTRITALPVPVREGVDALRVLTLTRVPAGLGLEPGARVLDAQWVDEESVLVLGADQVLRHHTEQGVRVVDEHVLGPISVSGEVAAYVQGEPPDLWLAVADLRGEQVQRLKDVAPAWSPALSQDGREVLFVASHEGRPHFFVRRADGELESLPTGQRTPSSAVAPLWRGGALFFEDERGVVRWDVETSSIEAQFDGARLLPHDGSQQVRIMMNEEERVIGTWTTGGER